MLAGNLRLADALQALVGGSGYARMFATGETQSSRPDDQRLNINRICTPVWCPGQAQGCLLAETLTYRFARLRQAGHTGVSQRLDHLRSCFL